MAHPLGSGEEERDGVVHGITMAGGHVWWLAQVEGRPETEAGAAHLNHHWTVESSSLHLPTEGCLCEADVHVRVDIEAITLKHITVLDLREKVQGRV